jgi:ATP-binding cassette, subfamily C (CFTR/MRP), member 4
MATVIDVTGKKRQSAPISEAWIWSRLSFSFVNSLVKMGAKKELEHSDLPSLPEEDHAAEVTDAFERAWKDPASQSSLWKVMYMVFGRAFWTSGIWCFLESMTRISQPVLLGFFLDWLTSSNSNDLYRGLIWAGSIALVAFIQALIHHQLYYDTMKLGWNVRIAMSGLIHRKMLRLHAAAASNAGKLVNLVSNDTMRFDNFFPRLHFGWSGPMDLVIVFTILVLKVGWLATFAGTSIVFLSVPVSLYFGKQLARRRSITAGWTDKRVRMTTELLDGILSVKAFCWGDTLVSKRVEKLRGEERASIFKAMLMKSFNEAVSFATPYIATLMTFLTFWLQGETLDIAIVFSTMSLIHVLRISIGKNLFYFIETFPEVLVSVRRMRDFMELPEMTSPPSSSSSSQRVLLENASFAWGLPDGIVKETTTKDEDHSKRPANIEMGQVKKMKTNNTQATVLRDVSMKLADGDLVIVSGSTGCGKTALLKGILGEIPCVQGVVERTKRVAVVRALSLSLSHTHTHTLHMQVQQEPWIMAGTLRENIVWSSRFDQKKYDEILKRCQLDEDIATLSDGDLTEIGEKGVNLSGGQRARVSLARACYANANLYLLDDPLSAVDPNVSRRLFNDVILWLCRNRKKSVVLVTHHKHFSSYADRVLCLDPSGNIDSYEKVTKKKVEEEVEKKGNDLDEEKEDEEDDKDDVETDTSSSTKTYKLKNKTDPVALVLKEERTLGDVSSSTYISYISSGGLLLVFVLLLLFTGGQVAALMSDISLEKWADKPESEQDNPALFYMFMTLTLIATLAGFIRAALFFYVGLKASSTLHTKALNAVIRSPMSWFISNPVGRIINKFSADLGSVDEILPVTMLQCLTGILLCIGAVVLSCVAIPYLSIPVVPLFVVMLYVRWYFLCSSRALKRLDAISKSPVFVSFNCNLEGRSTIRAFEATDFTRDAFEKRLETNARAWYHWLLVNRWVGTCNV